MSSSVSGGSSFNKLDQFQSIIDRIGTDGADNGELMKLAQMKISEMVSESDYSQIHRPLRDLEAVLLEEVDPSQRDQPGTPLMDIADTVDGFKQLLSVPNSFTIQPIDGSFSSTASPQRFSDSLSVNESYSSNPSLSDFDRRFLSSMTGDNGLLEDKFGFSDFPPSLE
jgi:hypothetical protein